MSESTLTETFDDICNKVADYLGYEHGPDFGNDATKKAIIGYVKSGLAQFYFPPPQEGVVYEWSFLRPLGSLTIADGTRTTNLPDDFGTMVSPLIITTDGVRATPIQITNVVRIQKFYMELPDSTGQPDQVAVVALKDRSIRHGQRFQLYSFPEADQDYTVEFTYSILPSCLDGLHPYTFGGAAHSETILASCLEVAERLGDNLTKGPNYQHWMERLAASISYDKRNKPHYLGYNGDNSDGRNWNQRRLHGWGNGITYNGIEY